jgi:hypothetical protein
MEAYKKYILSTILYGICAMMGIISSIYSIIHYNLLIIIISLLFIYVSVDNFFCSSRAKACNRAAATHYMMPPFLRK